MKQEMSVLGIDIAKRVFHAVGMDDTGKIVCRKRLARHDLMPFLAKLPRCSSAWKPVAARMTGRDAAAGMATR
jgi:transposase